MKYTRLTLAEIERYIKIGQKIAEEGKDVETEIDEMIRNGKLERWEVAYNGTAFIRMGYEGKNPEEKIYYRIGEPRIDRRAGTYYNSHNFAENKQEVGISVVTEKWLHSLKSVFFGAHDNDYIKARGVYKIKGIQIGVGGDDEPLIYATDWAEKTRIRSFSGLEKAVK